MDRILALDYGDRRVGVAVSDPLGYTAQGLPTIIYQKLPELLNKLSSLIEKWRIRQLLVGIPLTMNGQERGRAEITKEFVQELKRKFHLPVVLWDERLSSTEAKKIAVKLGIKTGYNKQQIDRIAAVLILQGYLDSQQERYKSDKMDDKS